MRSERSDKRRKLESFEEAAEWLYELRSEDSRRYQAYATWLLESPRHVEAFLQVSTVDAALPAVDPEHVMPVEQTTTGESENNVVTMEESAATSPIARAGAARESRSGRRLAMTAAAVALLGIVVTALWTTIEALQWTEYLTATGEQRTIRLADGSTLYINTASRLKVRYSEHERDIRLLAGEALFNVRADPARPFRVRSGDATIQAVGTRFNVWRHDTGSTVSVIDGRIRAEPIRSGDTVYLDAGEAVQLHDNGSAGPVGKANLARLNGWPQRRLIFIDKTLGDIIAEFQRYNRFPRLVAEGAASELRDYSTLSFDAGDIASLLAVLETDPNLELERTGERIVIRLSTRSADSTDTSATNPQPE